MRYFSLAVGATAFLGLAACTAAPQTAATQMAPASPGGAAAAPVTANSMPRGDVVNAPRAPSTGTVSTTVPTRTY